MSRSETEGVAELSQRLEELERQNARLSEWAQRTDRENRLLKWIGVLAVLGLIGVLAVPRIPVAAEALGLPRPVRLTATEKGVGTQEFSLRNGDDVQMAVLECDKFGAPNLVMLDLKRRYRLGLKVWDDDRADLSLFDANGRLRGRFGVAGDGAVALSLSAEEGRDQVRLAIGSDGQPSLVMKDAEGKVVFQAPTPTPAP